MSAGSVNVRPCASATPELTIAPSAMFNPRASDGSAASAHHRAHPRLRNSGFTTNDAAEGSREHGIVDDHREAIARHLVSSTASGNKGEHDEHKPDESRGTRDDQFDLPRVLDRREHGIRSHQ